METQTSSKVYDALLFPTYSWNWIREKGLKLNSNSAQGCFIWLGVTVGPTTFENCCAQSRKIGILKSQWSSLKSQKAVHFTGCCCILVESKKSACSSQEIAARIQNPLTLKTTSKPQFLPSPALGIRIKFPQRHARSFLGMYLLWKRGSGLLVLSLLQWGLYKFIPLLHWWGWCRQWGHDCSYLGPSRVSGEL